MSIELITQPNKTINGVESQPNAAKTQLPFVFQREDAQINTVYTSGGNAVFKLTGETQLTDWPTGSRVFISDWRRSSDVNDNPGGFTEIINSDLLGGEVRIFTSSIPYASGEQPVNVGFVVGKANRQNYRVNIRIVEDAAALIHLFPGLDFNYVPDPTGRLFVNVGPALMQYMKANEINSQLFRLRYWEQWDGGQSNAVNSNQVQAVAARLDRAAEFGSNMFQTLLRIGGSKNNLTWPKNEVFEAPEYGGGSPWTIFERGHLRTDIDGDGGSSIYLKNQFKKNSIANKTNFSLDYKMKYNVQDFVSGGNVLLQIQSAFIGGGVDALIGSVVLVQITGDTGFTEISNTVALSRTQAECDGLIFRIAKPLGVNARIQIDIDEREGDFLNIEADAPAKILTRFENPLKWKRWKRSLSYLIDDRIASRLGDIVTWLRTYEADINKNPVGGILEDQRFDGHQIATGFVSEPSGVANVAFIRARVANAGRTEIVSEQIFYKLSTECKNPVCVRWLNSLGGFDEHLFSISQVIKTTNTEGTIFNNPVTVDLYENDQRTKGRTNVDETQTMLLTAENLTRDQFEALKEIKNSEAVSIYLTKDGSELLPVICRENLMTEIDTDGGFFRFDVTIELPEGTDFYKAKKY